MWCWCIQMVHMELNEHLTPGKERLSPTQVYYNEPLKHFYYLSVQCFVIPAYMEYSEHLPLRYMCKNREIIYVHWYKPTTLLLANWLQSKYTTKNFLLHHIVLICCILSDCGTVSTLYYCWDWVLLNYEMLPVVMCKVGYTDII